MRRSTIVFVTGVTLFLIIIIAASFVPGAVDATASETLQAECATDAANDRAEVEARQSWTPTDTPTATSTASPTPTATPTMWIECDINDIDIAAGDTMTVPYTIYSEYRGPGAHNVALSFFVDHERVAIVMTSLPDPTGVNSAQRAVDWRAAWNDGVHEVLLIVESSEYAPLEAECRQWFGNMDFAPLVAYHQTSEGETFAIEKQISWGDVVLGALDVMCLFPLGIGVMAFMLIQYWRRR